jgi:hypothetical protein
MPHRRCNGRTGLVKGAGRASQGEPRHDRHREGLHFL